MKELYLYKFSFLIFFLSSALLSFLINDKTLQILFLFFYLFFLFFYNFLKINNYSTKSIFENLKKKIISKKYLFLIILSINLYVINEYFIQNEKFILFFLIYSLSFFIFFFSEDIKFKSEEIMKYIFYIYALSIFLEIFLFHLNIHKFIEPAFFFHGPFLNKNISASLLVFLLIANNKSKNIDIIITAIFIIFLFKSAIALLIMFLYLLNEKLILPNYLKITFYLVCLLIIVYIFPREADVARINNYFAAIIHFFDFFSLGLGTSGSIGTRLIGFSSLGLESSLFYFINEFSLFFIFFLAYEYLMYSKVRFLNYYLICTIISGISFSPFFFISYLFILKYYHDSN